MRWKGNVVEVEVALEAEEALHDLREVPTNDAAAGKCFRKPAQPAQGCEGRVFGIVNEVAPVLMLIRPATAEDAWHTGAAVAEDALQLAPMRRSVFEELRTRFDDLPPAGVDHDKEVEMVFHDGLGAESWLNEPLNLSAE
jgi:hypothetical protein